MQPLKSKEDIVWAVESAARYAIQQHSSMNGMGYSMSSNSLMGQLSDLIAKAVAAGCREVLQNLYTNQEFEQDLGLNK